MQQRAFDADFLTQGFVLEPLTHPHRMSAPAPHNRGNILAATKCSPGTCWRTAMTGGSNAHDPRGSWPMASTVRPERSAPRVAEIK